MVKSNFPSPFNEFGPSNAQSKRVGSYLSLLELGKLAYTLKEMLLGPPRNGC